MTAQPDEEDGDMIIGVDSQKGSFIQIRTTALRSIYGDNSGKIKPDDLKAVVFAFGGPVPSRIEGEVTVEAAQNGTSVRLYYRQAGVETSDGSIPSRAGEDSEASSEP